MKQPCEIVVWYAIPAIRSLLAKELSKLGMKQIEISNVLEITQPAVSQYLSDKRGGGEVKFNDEIDLMIRNLALDLYKENISQIDMIPRICDICRKIRVDDILCMLHKEKGGVPDKCKLCLDKNFNNTSQCY
ncbi:transcriptional regulator [Methanobrevibacter sp. OttesenSCG-928-K11]|nr:transcriptional regulator [Methanobrevibacter sp. OttesenSCG-928-K11]